MKFKVYVHITKGVSHKPLARGVIQEVHISQYVGKGHHIQ